MRIKDFTDTIRHLTDPFNIPEARRMIQENPALTQEQFKAGGIVEPGVTHYATTPSAERMKFLDGATKFMTNGEYTKYNDVPNSERALKVKIGQTATRRQKNVPIGKGAPGVEKTAEHKAKIKEKHWSTKKDIKKITHSPKKIAYWESKTKIQKAILEQVENGVLNSKQIAKNLGLSHKEVIDDSEKLFRNIYEQRMKVNKGEKVTSRILPKTREGLKGLLNDLWKVEGFATPEGRNWFKLIRDARESGKITIDQFKKANMNVTNFFKLKNEIQLKYPKLILNLDHPLSYGALEGLGAKGEKFLTGIPTTERFNKGIKQRLDNKYASIASDVRQGVPGAVEKKIAMEKLVKNLNIDIGEISKSGKKIVSLGKKDIVLGKDRIGKSVIQSLKEQNILAKKIKDIDPALTKAAGMENYFKKTKLPAISKAQITGVKKIIEKIGCPGKAAGGRVGFAETGSANCFNLGREKIKTGQIKPGAEEFNFKKLIKAAKGVRGVARATGLGLAWEAAFAPIIVGWMGSQGESWERMKHELAYGPILEGLGVPAKYVPGISAEEELVKYMGKDAFDLSKIYEIYGKQEMVPAWDPSGKAERFQYTPGEFDFLKAEEADAIYKSSKIGGEGYETQSLKQIRDQIKKQEQEAIPLIGSFYEGPAGQHFAWDKLETADKALKKGLAELEEAKKAKIAERQEKGLLAEEDWTKNFDYRGYRDGGIVSLLKK